MREPWADTFVVVSPKERCPFCDTTTSPIPARTKTNEDGRIERWRVCRVCSRRYRFVLDPTLRFPVSGMLSAEATEADTINDDEHDTTESREVVADHVSAGRR